MNPRWSERMPPPVVRDEVLKRFLRYPVQRPLEGALAEAEAWVRAWFAAHARPWSCAAIGDHAMRSAFGPRFAPGDQLVIVAVSAGPEPGKAAAQEWARDRPDRYYFLECYAAAVVDELLQDARRRLSAARHQCPGYPSWPIGDNLPLLAALRRQVALPGVLDVLESGMLRPQKSQLAVIALPRVPV